MDSSHKTDLTNTASQETSTFTSDTSLQGQNFLTWEGMVINNSSEGRTPGRMDEIAYGN